MKNIFLILIASLCIFTQFVHWRLERASGPATGVPVLYWVTDPNPARARQIAAYRAWLKARGYADVDLRVDAANNNATKVVLQGVTGVAGDLIDAHGPLLHFYRSIGILEEVTVPLARFGVRADSTYAAVRGEISFGDRLYGYPGVAALNLYVLNLDRFAELGLPPPSSRWTLDEFEAQGKRFIQRANQGRGRRDVFFASGPLWEELRRSVGVAMFNETFTAPALDGPAHAALLKRVRRWIYEDHILPTEAEVRSFNVDQTYGSIGFQLLQKGHFGMIPTGRWCLTQMRKMAVVRYGAVECPHGGFPNVVMSTKPTVVYAGGKQKELAATFLAYLASDENSASVTEDADSLPPDPAWLRRPEFLRPAKYTNEWALHRAFAEAAPRAIGLEYSPYLPVQEANKALRSGLDRFMNGLESAESSLAGVDGELRALIRRHLQRHPEQQVEYHAACARQKRIDAMKGSGLKITAAWIDNPYWRAYHLAQGRSAPLGE